MTKAREVLAVLDALAAIAQHDPNRAEGSNA